MPKTISDKIITIYYETNDCLTIDTVDSEIYNEVSINTGNLKSLITWDIRRGIFNEIDRQKN
jgi:hypothetical protein